MKEMADINPKAAAWFTGYADPMYWSDAFFGGSRYGHYTSNISESANAWLREAREKPLVEMLEDIRRKLMGWFQTRREEGQNASAECDDPLALAPNAASLLAVAERFGRTQYSHRRSNESVFKSPISAQNVTGSSIYNFVPAPAKNGNSSAFHADTRLTACCTCGRIYDAMWRRRTDCRATPLLTPVIYSRFLRMKTGPIMPGGSFCLPCLERRWAGPESSGWKRERAEEA